MNRTRTNSRNLDRRQVRCQGRAILRRSVRPTPDRHRGPSGLSQALTAYRRAIRCHERLARMAPHFFDATVVDRERHERAERRRRMATWEPILAKVYGDNPEPPSIATKDNDLPPLPSRRIQRVVDRELAGWQFWMQAAHTALEQHRRRRPHALPRLSQITRLLEISFAFRQLASGSFQPDPQREAAAQAEVEFALQRSYGQPCPPEPAPTPPAPAETRPAWPPPDNKRDLVPYAIVRGEHGLLCLRRINPGDK